MPCLWRPLTLTHASPIRLTWSGSCWTPFTVSHEACCRHMTSCRPLLKQGRASRAERVSPALQRRAADAVNRDGCGSDGGWRALGGEAAACRCWRINLGPWEERSASSSSRGTLSLPCSGVYALSKMTLRRVIRSNRPVVGMMSSTLLPGPLTCADTPAVCQLLTAELQASVEPGGAVNFGFNSERASFPD